MKLSVSFNPAFHIFDIICIFCNCNIFTDFDLMMIFSSKGKLLKMV